MMGTEKTIEYLIQERIKIVVVINKMDRLILEMKIPPADAYLKIKHTIEEINAVISRCTLNHENHEEFLVTQLTPPPHVSPIHHLS